MNTAASAIASDWSGCSGELSGALKRYLSNPVGRRSDTSFVQSTVAKGLAQKVIAGWDFPLPDRYRVDLALGLDLAVLGQIGDWPSLRVDQLQALHWVRRRRRAGKSGCLVGLVGPVPGQQRNRGKSGGRTAERSASVGCVLERLLVELVGRRAARYRCRGSQLRRRYRTRQMVAVQQHNLIRHHRDVASEPDANLVDTWHITFVQLTRLGEDTVELVIGDADRRRGVACHHVETEKLRTIGDDHRRPRLADLLRYFTGSAYLEAVAQAERRHLGHVEAAQELPGPLGVGQHHRFRLRGRPAGPDVQFSADRGRRES